MSQLFTPARVGRYTLQNRLVMAPMTRSRAAFDGTPGQWAAEYYAQRASLGLIVTEGTQPSDDGQGYLTTPGIYTDAHVAGWKTISDAVHARGSRLFIQLMHVGRMSHPDNTPHHRQGVAPSAIAPGAQMFTVKGMQDIPVPRALTTEEVRATVDDFRTAARRAIEAGADGVEIHGANGYLVQQFFSPNANTRTDVYGGSIENRARFAIEVATAIADEIGADRTAIRLSPGATLGGVDEGEQGPDLNRYLVTELDRLGLAYLHVMHHGNEALLADLRALERHADPEPPGPHARRDRRGLEDGARRSRSVRADGARESGLRDAAEDGRADERRAARNVLRRRCARICGLSDAGWGGRGLTRPLGAKAAARWNGCRGDRPRNARRQSSAVVTLGTIGAMRRR
ncbi:12-oxophytodienoate reductase [Burkholderia metallica]|nr:12-oxophytodienoate reductase [Burkholderia metallica]